MSKNPETQTGGQRAMSGTEATLIKIGVAVIQRVAPSGIALVKSWIKGKEIVVLGQARAGKTTFLNYLQYGLFEDERDTFRTVEVSDSARFNVKVGRDAALELIVRTAVDVPGQGSASSQADLVFDRRPHAVIIVTDLTTPLTGESDRASGAWLAEFCRRLEARWRANRRKKNRLKTMIIMMNKQDKVTEKKVTSHKNAIRKILDAELRDARGEMLTDIAIMPTVVVNNPDGSKSVDAVISYLARELAK